MEMETHFDEVIVTSCEEPEGTVRRPIALCNYRRENNAFVCLPRRGAVKRLGPALSFIEFLPTKKKFLKGYLYPAVRRAGVEIRARH